MFHAPFCMKNDQGVWVGVCLGVSVGVGNGVGVGIDVGMGANLCVGVGVGVLLLLLHLLLLLPLGALCELDAVAGIICTLHRLLMLTKVYSHYQYLTNHHSILHHFS
jgi:hypothetical protein